MKKIVLVISFFVVALGVLISGCVENVDDDLLPGEGRMVLYISDKPADIDDFDLLNVSFFKVRIHTTGNDTEGNWTERAINETIDLTKLVGPNAIRIVNITLKAGNYSKIELYVNDTLGIVDGNETEVFVPSGKLMINKNFSVEANKTVKFVFDINVVKRGNQDKYNLLPVISESGVVGKDLSDDEFVEV